MRIGYIGHFGDYHTEWGVSKALGKYAKVDKYHYKNLDKKKFTKRQYDIVLTSVPHCLPLGFWLAQDGLKIAHYFDLIVDWWGRDKSYFPILKYFDLVLSTDGSDSSVYKKAGINRKWLKQAVDITEYYPVKKNHYFYDVAFIGGSYGTRQKLFKELSQKYNFMQFNGGYRGEGHAEVCATSKIMVADNARNNIPGYWSNRVYLHLACGAFVLHPSVPGMDKVFKDGQHLVYYDNREDLMNKIDLYLGNDKERKRISKTGHELVKKSHTWDVRIDEWWEYVSELLPTQTKLPA